MFASATPTSSARALPRAKAVRHICAPIAVPSSGVGHVHEGRRQLAPSRPALASERSLHGPCVVKLTGSRKATGKFNRHPNPNANLQEYMTHASEHFAGIPLPMGGKLRKLDGNRMEMTVPRIELFDIWLQPKAITNVQVKPNRAEITSSTGDCVLTGSSHVAKLGLQERFNLDVRIVFTWDNTSTSAKHHHLQVQGHLEVEVDVPAPFSLMPKPMIKATGDAAIGTVLAAIADSFLGKLSRDYDSWARAMPAKAVVAAPVKSTAPGTAAHNRKA